MYERVDVPKFSRSPTFHPPSHRSVPSHRLSAPSLRSISTLTPIISTLTPIISTLAPIISTLTPIISTLTPIISALTPIYQYPYTDYQCPHSDLSVRLLRFPPSVRPHRITVRARAGRQAGRQTRAHADHRGLLLCTREGEKTRTRRLGSRALWVARYSVGEPTRQCSRERPPSEPSVCRLQRARLDGTMVNAEGCGRFVCSRLRTWLLGAYMQHSEDSRLQLPVIHETPVR